MDGDDVYWIEGRPQDGGRNVLVRRRADGSTVEVGAHRPGAGGTDRFEGHLLLLPGLPSLRAELGDGGRAAPA